MSRALCIVWVFVLSITALAQLATVQADANFAAEAEIKSLELKLADWIVQGQWDEYGQHLGADYLHTGYNGHVENREQALAALRDEHRKIIVMELEPADQFVRIYGDMAIFNGEFTVSVRELGQLKTRRIRATDTLVRREGKWCLVAGQTTSIGK